MYFQAKRAYGSGRQYVWVCVCVCVCGNHSITANQHCVTILVCCHIQKYMMHAQLELDFTLFEITVVSKFKVHKPQYMEFTHFMITNFNIIFQLVTDSDELGETTCVTTQLPPHFCYCTHHSQLSQHTPFIIRGRLLLCFVQNESPSQ
jgi:hypothetical protein